MPQVVKRIGKLVSGPVRKCCLEAQALATMLKAKQYIQRNKRFTELRCEVRSSLTAVSVSALVQSGVC